MLNFANIRYFCPNTSKKSNQLADLQEKDPAVAISVAFDESYLRYSIADFFIMGVSASKAQNELYHGAPQDLSKMRSYGHAQLGPRLSSVSGGA